MTPGDAASARAQLARLAAHRGEFVALPDERGDVDPGRAREAAVLVLFGELDRRPSIHTATSPAVSRDLDVLLLARATTLSSHAGQVAFPGGRVDPEDGGSVAAALREANEETGLDPTGVEVLGELQRIPLPFSNHIVTPVLSWWERPTPVGVVDPNESSDVFRVPVADLLDPEARRTTVIRRDGRSWRGPAFTVDRHLVWGFTAMVLDGMFDRLGWTEEWDRSREIEM